MIFQSAAMRQLLDRAQRFADSSATVLIQGESGTGKELLASWLQQHSTRSDKPFVRLNCAAIQRDLVASELFGHEHGAFTGAVGRRHGCLEAAADGTLFLDEVGELPESIQAMLLRVLEENEFYRVGSHELLKVNARIITATNKDLEQAVAEGTFREDLYHRLNVLTLDVPPLKARPEDVPLLADHFLRESAAKHNSDVQAFSADVVRQLMQYDWPGNVRQLRNIILRACLLADSDIIESIDLPARRILPFPTEHVRTSDEILPLKEVERQAILACLDQFDSDRSRTAAALGITTRTLRNKLSLYQHLDKAS